MPISCRFYSQKYPEIDDVVMVNVRAIAEMGAYVHLLDYNNIEGMILLSELSRRRIRSINKLIRVGRNECVVVIRVDKEKGYIDLSKRRVSPEDIEQCRERFAKAKAVNGILRHVAELMNYQTDEEFEELYHKTAWHFDTKYKKNGGSFDAFRLSVNDPSILDECGLDEETKKALIADIKWRLTPTAVKIRADIEVACYGYEGIDAVKNALRSAIEYSSDDMPIKINLIAPPQYVVTTTTLDQADGLKALEEALEKVREVITSVDGGNFKVILAPKIVTDMDEADLAKKMESAEKALLEVSGDEAEDSELSGDDEEDDDDAKKKLNDEQSEEEGEGEPKK